ncbi:MAG: peptide ABC transporter substrate-binding protein [Lachnospiraceae bacterium]|nr:peptide ABC transporter substrate-binding protein [Lachnospiraceae bacterium]
MRKFAKTVSAAVAAAALVLSSLAAPSAVRAEEEEKTVTLGVSTLWETFNFMATTSTPTHVVIEEIFDKLLIGNNDGSYSPRLADSWEIDGTKVTFHLNEDATWHDGVPVTAEDVVYTFQVKTNKEAGWLAGTSPYVEGTDDTGYELSEDSIAVTAVDDHTVEMTLKTERDPDLVLTSLNSFILPAHLLADIPDTELADADFWDAPIGSGPFKFDSQIDGERVEYTANEDYYLGAPDFDRLVIRFMDASTLAAGLLNGEVDITSDISLSDLDIIQESDAITLESVTSNQFQTLVINLEDEAFTTKVREAIDAAINKQLLVDQLLKGYGEPAITVLPSTHPYYNEEITEQTYDPEYARQLLEEEGWDFDRVLNLTVPKGNQARERSAILIQQNLAAVGIQTEIVTYDFATALQNMRDNKYDLLLMGAAGTYDPAGAGAVDYFSHTTDPKFKELGDAGKAGLSFEERKPIYDEYQLYFVQEHPLVMLYFSDRLVAYNNRISNLPISTVDYWNNKLSWTWKVEE